MKVNLYSADQPNCLVLRVADAPDITEILFNFLMHISEVDEASLEVLDENTIQFAIEEGIPEDQYKDWKLSVINSVREMLTQDEGQLKEHYLISHQQLEAIEKEFDNAQAELLQAKINLLVQNKINERLMVVAGLAIMVAIVATAVAIVGIFV